MVSVVQAPDGTWLTALTTSASPDVPAGEALTIITGRRTNDDGKDELRFLEALVDEALRAAEPIDAAVHLGPGLPIPMLAHVPIVEEPPEGVVTYLALQQPSTPPASGEGEVRPRDA